MKKTRERQLRGSANGLEKLAKELVGKMNSKIESGTCEEFSLGYVTEKQIPKKFMEKLKTQNVDKLTDAIEAELATGWIDSLYKIAVGFDEKCIYFYAYTKRTATA